MLAPQRRQNLVARSSDSDGVATLLSSAPVPGLLRKIITAITDTPLTTVGIPYRAQRALVSATCGLSEVYSARTADYDAQPETRTEAERQTEFTQMGVIYYRHGWYPATLCEAKEEEARAPYESVRLEWSYEALGRGADMVLSLRYALPASQEDDSGVKRTRPRRKVLNRSWRLVMARAQEFRRTGIMADAGGNECDRAG